LPTIQAFRMPIRQRGQEEEVSLRPQEMPYEYAGQFMTLEIQPDCYVLVGQFRKRFCTLLLNAQCSFKTCQQNNFNHINSVRYIDFSEMLMNYSD
jgi:hypothetical protein